MSWFSVEGIGTRYFVVVDSIRVGGPFQSHPLALDARDRLERLSKMKEHACMTCGKVFMSEGAHNRMCDPCRSYHREVVAV